MRLRGLALAAILATLGPAAAARAATTVGSDLSKPANAPACGSACTAFTTLSSTGAPVAVAPFDGVIVRWRVKAGAPAANVALRTIRGAGTGSYTGTGASDPQTVPIGTSTFATRLPVQAGDIIGVDAGANAMLASTSATTDIQVFSPQLNTFAHIPGKQPNRELLVNADIEHDADGDGYGDETQDLCPTDPSRHTACLSNVSVNVRPDPAPLTVGRTLTFTIKVANDGPSPAQDVGLVVNLPFSATPLQARVGHGSCSGAFTFTCQIGTIAANDQVTAVLSVRPELVGTLLMTAQASTSTAETTTDDDAFTSDVTVLPPTLRLLGARLSRTVIGVGGRTSIRWYETDAAAVKVKVEQISHRGRIRSLGSFNVAGHAGPNSVAFHGRVPGHRRLKAGRYRFLVSAATRDGRVAAPAHLSFLVRHP